MPLTTYELNSLFPRSNVPTCVPYAEGWIWESAVALSDGRILYVWREGGEIKQGYAQDERAFYSDGSIGNVTTILSGLGNQSSCVFKAPNGGIHLAVSNGVGVTWVKIYYSPSNLGGDWVFKSNVLEGPINHDGGQGTGLMPVGLPWMSGSRWVLSCPEYVRGAVDSAYAAIYVSTNAGASWSRRAQIHYYILNGLFGYGGSRNIGEFDGKLWWATDGNVYLPQHNWSSDAGETWNLFESDFAGLTYHTGDADYLYRSQRNGIIKRSSTPLVNSSWSTYRDYDLIQIGLENYHSMIVQKLSRTWMVSSSGRMLNRNPEAPPLRQRQRDDTRYIRQLDSQQQSLRQSWPNAYL